jgi:hypothetical protein
VRRELKAHQQRTGIDGDDLVSGRTAAEGVLRLHDPRESEQGLARSRS